MKKKILSFVITIALVLTLVPTEVFGVGGSEWEMLYDALSGCSLVEGETIGHITDGKVSLDGKEPYIYEVVDKTDTDSGVITRTITLLKDVVDEDNRPLEIFGTYHKDYPDEAPIEIILDLNGFTLDRGLSKSDTSVDGMCIRNSGTLTIRDNSAAKTGCITGGNAIYGGAVYVCSSAELNFESGTISTCSAISSDYDSASSLYGRGGAVYVCGGCFNMIGGSIKNCESSVAGGAVYVAANGRFNMSAGTITNCTVDGCSDGGTVKAKGGAVYLLYGSTMTMTGGEISGNKLGKSDCGDMRGAGVYVADSVKSITLGGTAKIRGNFDYDSESKNENKYDIKDNLYIYNKTNARFNIDAATVPETGTNGMDVWVTSKVTQDNPQISLVEVSTNINPDYIGCFHADNENERIGLNHRSDLYYVSLVKPCSIVYKDQGGTDFSGTHENGYPREHVYGTETVLKSATKTDFTFDGWFTNSDCTSDSAITAISANTSGSAITLYAKWTEKAKDMVVVTFDANGGTCLVTSAAIEQGATLTSLPSASRENHTFNGWFTEQKNGTQITTSTTFIKNTTIYAHWTEKKKDPEPWHPWRPYTPVTPVEPAFTNPFVDVAEGTYYYDAVLWAAKTGITDGVDATHFAPEKITSRAQMVTFLWRAAGCPVSSLKTCPFTDVAMGTYFYDAVLWALENGITDGTSATTFSPDKEVTRAQSVTFLARLNGVKDDATGYSSNFTDLKAGAYYNNAVAWAFENGITDGTSATTFSPDNDCLRCQVVTYLYRNFVKAE